MKITAERAQLLTASTESRRVRYRLLPYGEAGRTNLGTLTASAGAVTVPEDVTSVRLNVQHDRGRPVGKAVEIEETDDGLVAEFDILGTREGDDLLAEIAAGLRPGVSVELERPVIRSGRLVAGRLSWAGAVSEPAFPSALLVAEDAGDLAEAETDEDSTDTDDTDDTDDEAETDEAETDEAGPEDDQHPDEETPDMNTKTPARAAAGTLAASKAGQAAGKKGTPLSALVDMLTRARDDRTMLAALSDVVPGNILGIEQPQYVGELWDGKAYERKIVPRYNHAELTSFEVTGWRWVTRPAVAAYAGDKADVPSNEIETEQVKIAAARIAGAHDIDRKFKDFNDTEFFNAYFAAMTESYARVSDAEVLADVLAAATPVTAGTVPTDVSPGMVSIVDGALAILNATDTLPTGAVVATDVWREIILTRKDDTLAYLNAAMGLESGELGSFSLVPSSALSAGQVLVDTKSAVTVHELGGPAPIRVEALDIARGGVDEGVFGYYAVNVHDARGLALVTPAGAGA